MKIKELKNNKRFMEVFRFLITGGLSFVVDYGILIGLTTGLSVNYLISSAISFTVSVIVNYYLCVLWVFDGADKSNDKKVVIMFIGSSVIGLIFNQILMYLFVSILGVFYMVAKIITTAIVMVWNYVMKKMALVRK